MSNLHLYLYLFATRFLLLIAPEGKELKCLGLHNASEE